MNMPTEPTGLYVQGREFAVLPAGAYPATLIKIVQGTRSEYGVKDASPDEQIPCFMWTYRIDLKRLPTEIQKRINDKEDDFDITATDQVISTGVNFGSQRATLTKMVRNLAANPKLTLEEAKRINLLSLVGTRVLLVLDEVASPETGEIRNRITTITRETKDN